MVTERDIKILEDFITKVKDHLQNAEDEVRKVESDAPVMGDIVEVYWKCSYPKSFITKGVFYSKSLDDYWILKNNLETPLKFDKDIVELRKTGRYVDLIGLLEKVEE